MNPKLKAHISRTIVAIRRKAPFYAYLATTREFVEDPKAETCWTNGPQIGCNPEFALSLTVDEFRTVIVHELEHVRKGDPWRLRLFLAGRLHSGGKVTSEDQQRWNKAADHSINNRLLRAGFTPVEAWLCDPKYDGWSTEAIFPEMTYDPEEQGGDPAAGEGGEGTELGGEPGEGGEGEKGAESPSNTAEGGEGSESQDGGSEGDTGDSKASSGDSGAEGESGEGDAGDPTKPTKPNPCGECRPFDGTAEEAQRELDSRKMDCRNAQRYAEGIGTMDGAVSREVTEMLKPKVDYAELLAEFMHEHVMTNTNWFKLQPEYAVRGIGQPRLDEPSMGDVIFYVDTSGSMSSEAFEEVAGHVTSVCADLDAVLHVICVDDSVRNYQRFDETPELEEIKVVGGGNTSFRPGFEFADKKAIDPVCAIYFTDMCCSRWPEREPDYPVLFVQWGAKHVEESDMPFGELIHCGKEA